MANDWQMLYNKILGLVNCWEMIGKSLANDCQY